MYESPSKVVVMIVTLVAFKRTDLTPTLTTLMRATKL